MKNIFPIHIKTILLTLQKNGFEGFVIGGPTRDILLKKDPQDWDITTNANPDQIQRIFPDSIYSNHFGTVGIKVRHNTQITEIVEITTYRKESPYTDHRHPKEVQFVSSLQEDTNRRDFTINALALDFTGTVYDYHQGQQDLKNQLIRTVGNPQKRFQEDALRLIRAIRFAVQLNFSIEAQTWTAIQNQAQDIQYISWERIRDELNKIFMTSRAMQGFELLEQAGLLQYILPELREGIGIGQNGHHIYDVWKHLLHTMQHACDQNWSLDLRVAGLLHDIAKPRTKEGEGKSCTFHGHEVVGASMSYDILMRLRYPKKFCAKISKLVRYHMFYYDTNIVTESSVRKLVNKISPEYVKDLIKLRECDRVGSGTPKARPYRLRHFEYMTEKVLTDPVSLSMLKIDGNILIQDLKISPGPTIGAILSILLAEVLDDPTKNTQEYLLTRALELQTQNLQQLKFQANKKIQAEQDRKDQEIKNKYYV